MTATTTATVPPRAVLEAALAAGFPDWKVVPSEREVDDIDRPLVQIKQRDLKPLTEAPQSHYTMTVLISLIDDHIDFEAAEQALDTNVLTLWEYLMTLSNVHPTSATKVTWNDTNLAYDITTDLTVSKG